MATSEAMKSTVAGVCLAALLAGIGELLSQNNEAGRHFVKIDAVLEQNQGILKKIEERENAIPPVIESKISEIRDRLNIIEQRQAELEKRRP